MVRDAFRRRAQHALRLDRQRRGLVAARGDPFRRLQVSGDAVAQLAAEPVGEGLDGRAAPLEQAALRLSHARPLRPLFQRQKPPFQI